MAEQTDKSNQPLKMRYRLAKSHLQSEPGGSSVEKQLNLLLSEKKIREIDRAFGLFLHQRLNPDTATSGRGAFTELQKRCLDENQQLLLIMLAVLTSEQLSRQHVCLELNHSAMTDKWQNGFGQPFAPHFIFPEAEECQKVLRSPAFEKAGLLVFENQRLYLQRYWHYEQQICFRLKGIQAPQFEHAHITQSLEQLYPNAVQSENREQHQDVDWQKNAIALACLNSVTIIAGGPGTGKTTTVVRILWALTRLYQQSAKPSAIIKMVAPTGKAAARLSESVSGALSQLPDTTANIPTQCSTIHRLLGVKSNSVFFRHNAELRLNIDVLVVDEASMIDLPLLAKLLMALPDHCRLILLGDSHQLASVEVGSVFSDICSLKQGENYFSDGLAHTLIQLTAQQGWGPNTSEDMRSLFHENDIPGSEPPFTDNIIFLTKSWRFDAHSGIGQLARAVNNGNVASTFEVLNSPHDDITWFSEPNEKQLLELVLPHFVALHEAAEKGDVSGAFELLGQCQILTVQRTGPWGLHHINHLIKRELVKRGLIRTDQEFYAGRPVMISSNDYNNQLFNGDIGIAIPLRADSSSQLKSDETMLNVWFRDTEQGFRSLLTAQLPEHETLYAMTTHKSQGSEFAKVLFCFPEAANLSGTEMFNGELLNRELLYTGITRAKRNFILFAQGESIKRAVSRVCKRASGLAALLMNAGDDTLSGSK